MRNTLAFWSLLTLSATALAGGTAHWTHTTEADFKKGKFSHVVATNLGDLKLSRAVKTLLEQDPRVSAVYALAEGPDGTIYAGTGPQGVVLQLKGEKVSTAATVEEENVFSLLVEQDGKLLIGTGGEKGRILRVEPGKAEIKPVEVFKAEGVQYVWKIVRAPDGLLYAATGPNGQVFELKPDGTNSVLFDSDENNILSLIGDGSDTLYAGTDPNGLVYRINRKSKDVFVLYDAAEAEVGALALDGKGNLYAGTGQATEGDEGGGEYEGAAGKSGRPAGGEKPSTLPSQKPSDPKPPAEAPSEPGRIPGGRTSLILLDDTELFPGADDPGDVPAKPPTPRKRAAGRSPLGAGMMPPGMMGGPAGNAVYRIDSGGFVTEVFRQPGMVLSMLVDKDGSLLVGTGSEGLIYHVNPASEETVVLAKVEPKQVMGLLSARDGRIILGLANTGGLAAMSSGFAKEGTYTSPVLDANQISRFGKMRLGGWLPEGTTLTVSTRSGNIEEPNEASWSKWSAPVAAVEYVPVTSPAARFLQYRLAFTSKDGSATAIMEEVDVAYQTPNQAPVVKAVQVIAAPDMEGGPQGMRMPMRMAPPMMSRGGDGEEKQPSSGRMRIVSWEATDANEDEMEFALYIRSGGSGPWVLLEEKIKEPQYIWDTRTTADGRYQVKLVASDVKTNALGEGRKTERVSDPVVVDNTAPVIGDLKTAKLPRGVRIEARVIDRASTVKSVEYSIDAKDDWQAVSASDKIFDSPEEAVTFTVEGLAAGAHQVMLRATDDHGNAAHEAVRVVIEEK